MNLQRPHVRTRSPLPIPTDAIVAAASSARGDDPFNDTANAALADSKKRLVHARRWADMDVSVVVTCAGVWT